MKEQRIEIQQCRPGDIISRDVLDIRSGSTLLNKGHVLTQEKIDWLKNFRHSYIYIEDSSYDKVFNVSRESIECYKAHKKRIKTALTQISLGRPVDRQIINEVHESFFEKLGDNNTIMGCVNLVNTLDEYKYTHGLNVGMLSVLIGRWIGLEKKYLEDLLMAGILHDAGKFKINQRIMNKTNRLNPEEYALVKMHVLESYSLIKDNEQLSLAIKEGILSHHERIDGSGYPRKLKGEEIHLFGRIIAIADTYDAMTSERIYKKRQTPFEVMEKMMEEGMGRLDTKILLLFLQNIANYYIGIQVALNTGQVGEVVFMHPHRIYRPIIKVEDTYYDLDTRSDLQIVDMI